MSKEALTQDDDWAPEAVFTVGHSTLSLDAFIALLKRFGIKCLVDIRTVPRSRHNPQFNSDALPRALRLDGIECIPLRELGGLRQPRPDSPNTAWRNKGFRGYADHMQTEEFANGLAQLITLSGAQRTAIMCAEAVPWRCHRSLVSDALSVRGIPVVEILPDARYREHKLTSFARVDGSTITYPPEQAELF